MPLCIHRGSCNASKSLAWNFKSIDKETVAQREGDMFCVVFADILFIHSFIPPYSCPFDFFRLLLYAG
jgi:hypothetical protein